MKKPDNWKHESWLRRLLDPDRFDQIVYFEEAVLADSTTLAPKGYVLVLITENTVHLLNTGKDTSLNNTNSWLLTDFHAIHHLNDAATFFGKNSEVAAASRHIRCQVSDQVASPVTVIDVYSFYEDSTLYHFLFQAWQHAHARQALPVFYPTERNKLSKLSKLAIQAMYIHMETQLIATTKEDEEDAAAAAAPTGDEVEDARAKAQAAKLRAKRKKAADLEYWDIRLRIRILEEMTLASATHRSFKQLAFDSAVLIPFLLGQLRSLARFRAYLLGADPTQVWSYISSNEDLLPEDEVDHLRLAIACWSLLSRLLAGSESISTRTRLLAWHNTNSEREVREVMDALFLLGGIPVYGERSEVFDPASSSSSAASPARAGVTLATPSRFLEALDQHLDSRRSRSRFEDEDDERYKQKYLYNLRATRKWKEGVLGYSADELHKEASSATSANKAKLTSQASTLHLRDVPRIVTTAREEKAKALARRGPTRTRRNLAEKDRALDAPPVAEELGYDTVLSSNERASKVALEELMGLIPELEVVFLELLFHFQQLLEHVLEARLPHMTCNLESLFKHVLDATAEQDFKQMQIPVFARGLVFMCQKERRDTIAYYTFIYAAVIAKFTLRSAELRSILVEQHFLDLLTVDHANAAALHAAGGDKAGATPTLALLPDIKTSVVSTAARGPHFLQRTKPLLESMLKLMLDG